MDVIMPQLGETVLEGTVSVWYKKVGEPVSADEPLFEVETDKVTTQIPAPGSGVLACILVEPGVSVKVGTPLAVIEAPGASPSAPVAASAATPPASSGSTASALPQNSSFASTSRPVSTRLSPAVRRRLREQGIDPAQVRGSGRDGRITPQDVQAFADGRAAGEGARVVPLNKIRRITAAHMVRSRATSPHALQAVEVDFHRVAAARAAGGALWRAREGFTLTYLPFIARAICQAICKFPYVNSSFVDDELHVHPRVHLGVAVDMNFEGLAVTVIRDGQDRSLSALARQMHRLAEGARSGKLTPDEMVGSTYTLSNSGSFGTYFSASIINQPQVAILSVDAVRKKPWVIENPDGDSIGIRPIGVLAQSFDHRAFDGAYSAAFLRTAKDIIETTDWAAELVAQNDIETY